jgi:hypothetical protein
MDSINICTKGAVEPSLRHVKLTDHFLHQMHRMPKIDRLAFFDALANGQFDRAASHSGLDHVRGAACMGQSYVVFKVDDRDRNVLAFLTVLDPDKARTINRRRDTKLVRL